MTKQEEDCLSNQPTSGTTGYRKAMIESIVHDTIQEFINQMVPFYQSPYEEELCNDKNWSPNISTTTSAHSVTMESIEQIFQKMFQDNNSKSKSRNKKQAPLIAQEHDVNGLPITYCWYHGITSNLRKNRKSCKRQKEVHK